MNKKHWQEQPRHPAGSSEGGRWAPSGGGSGMNTGKVADAAAKSAVGSSNMRATQLAKQRLEPLQKVEPKVTQKISDIVADSGGEMYKLKYRLKTEESLAGKIVRDSENDNVSLEEAAEKINDVLRYTAKYDHEIMVAKAVELRETMESQGFEFLKVKNLLDGKRPEYRGINMQVKWGDTIFELQVHSNQTAKVVELNHPLYDKWRETKNAAEKSYLSQRMVENAAAVISPRNVHLLKDHP